MSLLIIETEQIGVFFFVSLSKAAVWVSVTAVTKTFFLLGQMHTVSWQPHRFNGFKPQMKNEGFASACLKVEHLHRNLKANNLAPQDK